jgi:hypothetical protein
MKTSNQFSLTSAPHWKVYTSFVSDIDLVAEGGTPCRLIRVNTGSAAALALKDAAGTAMDAIPNLNDGDEIKVIASVIKTAGTTVASVTVFW